MRRLLLVSVLAAVAGCSIDDGTVTGTVTLNGQPLKEGTVRFLPVDGKGPTASAEIKDGKFTAAVPPGRKRVEFSAPKIVGKPQKMYDTPDSPVVDQVDELIPARYNVASELTITVKGGSQTETFALTSP